MRDVNARSIDYPESWKAQKLKHLVALNPGKSEVSNLPKKKCVSFIAMENISTTRRIDSSRVKTIGDVYSGYTYFKDGDLLVAKITPCFENGKGGVARGLENGIGFGTTELHVLRASKNINIEFLNYLTCSHSFMIQGESQMTGSAGQKRVPEAFISNFETPIPPLETQRQIATFLDRKTLAIDELIARKQRMIELLEEKRSALINHVVTKGLDAGVKMKDSGIAWIGEVPEHWELTKIKHLAKPNSSKSFTDGDWVEAKFITDCGIRLIQTGNVGVGVYVEKGFRYINESDFGTLRCTEVCPNDVLICRLDGPVGRACLAPDLGAKMITSVDNAILKCREGIEPHCVCFILSSPGWLNWLQSISQAGGGKRWRISRSNLGNLKIPIPVTTEQSDIGFYLKEMSEKIEVLVKKATVSIAKLQEYRQALITAAVTGKIDVTHDPTSDDPAEALGDDQMSLL